MRRRLPIPLKPYPEELISSWILRLADAHHVGPRTFGRHVLGRTFEFNRDWDSEPGAEMIRALAQATGHEEGVLRQGHSLLAWEGLLFDSASATHSTRWVLPRGIIGARRPHQQFCPLCLMDAPFYRRHWRLSLFAVCPTHRVQLCVSCPQCSSALEFLRCAAALGPRSLHRCYSCGFDLRCTEPLEAPERDVRIARELGGILCGEITARPLELGAREFFFTLSQLSARLLSRGRKMQLWRRLVSQLAGCIVPQACSFRAPVNMDAMYPPIGRMAILRGAMWLLGDWPNRFYLMLKGGGIDFSDVFPQPFLYAPAVVAASRWPAGPPAQRETSAGRKWIARLNEFLLSRRVDWSPSKMPRLLRRLRAAGFFAPRTAPSQIERSIRRRIEALRHAGRDYRNANVRKAERSGEEWSRLLLRARPYRKIHCTSAEILRRGIRLLCADRFLSAQDLGALLHRSPEALRAAHLSPMLALGQLEVLHAKRNREGYQAHPQQAYRSAPT
ncbi:MAG: TniQ family protein [Verrucomicrobia bacterium]|nr:TniQ family protein [Verrucomicrobiota bacterium]